VALICHEWYSLGGQVQVADATLEATWMIDITLRAKNLTFNFLTANLAVHVIAIFALKKHDSVKKKF
jgi:hypothetical protein